MKQIIKDYIVKSYPLISKTRIHKITKSFYEGLGHILCFHRVLPNEKKSVLYQNRRYEISPQYLESIVNYFSKGKYCFINLDELSDYINRKQKKFVVFTFDDGYYDNIEYAYPILKKHNIPFTIYIISSFLERKLILWWYLIEDILLKNNRIHINIEGIDINLKCDTTEEKETAFNIIHSCLISLNNEKLIHNLLNIFSLYNINWEECTENNSISISKLKELGKEHLLNIGSHSVNHLPFNKLTIDEVNIELNHSKRAIESLLNREINHFSFPFGSRQQVGTREFELTKEAGYKTAVTTRMSNIYAQHLNNMTALPRIEISSIWEKYRIKPSMDFLLGFAPLMQNKGKRFVTI